LPFVTCQFVNPGEDLVQSVVDSLLTAAKEEGFTIKDKDVIEVTESLLARAQGNYVTIDEIVTDLQAKFGTDENVIVFPILSRNQFSMILQAITQAFTKVHLLLSYPADEVGNALIDIDLMDEAGINPYTDVLTEEDYHRIFGAEVKHPFTGLITSKCTKNWE